MSPRIRTYVFLFCAAVAFGIMVYAAAGLPAFGSFSAAYEDTILRVATGERHIYNIATAVNFDYRSFDTLGEEFIFFTSVAGVLFMLSSLKAEAKKHGAEAMESPAHRGQTGLVRWFPTGLTAFIAALGMDLAAHGQLSPGGGFQGGAVFGSAMACIYLGVGVHALLKTVRKELFDILDAVGAFSYAALGVATAFATGAFLKNVLPLGQTGATVSSGTIYFISCAVFVEIACGFSILVIVYLKQTSQTEEPEK